MPPRHRPHPGEKLRARPGEPDRQIPRALIATTKRHIDGKLAKRLFESLGGSNEHDDGTRFYAELL